MAREFTPAARPVSTLTAAARPYEAPAPVQQARPFAPDPLAAPTRPAQTNALMQFGAALSEINPKITGFLTSYVKQQAKQSEAEYENKLAMMSDEEASAFYKQERNAVSGPFQQALDRQFGVRKANATRSSIQAKIASGEINMETQDITQILSEAIKGDLEAFDSGDYQEGYKALMAQAAPQFREAHLKVKAAAKVKERDENFYSFVTDAMDLARENKMSPEEVAVTLQNLKQLHGPGTALNMDKQYMDDLIMNGIGYAADKGDVALVNALLDDERGGVGPLSKIARFKDKADAFRRTAKQRDDEIVTEANYGHLMDLYKRANDGTLPQGWFERDPELYKKIMSPTQAAGLMEANEAALERKRKEADAARAVAYEQTLRAQVGQHASLAVSMGNIHGLEDVEVEVAPGKWVTITAKQQAEVGLEQNMAGAVVYKPGTKEVDGLATISNQINVLTRNGTTYKPWENTLQGGMLAADFANQSPENRATFQRGFELYKQIKAANPELATKHAGTAREFYDAIEFQTTSITGGNEDAAIRNVLAIREDPERAKANLSRVTREVRERAAKTVRNSERWGMFFGKVVDAGAMGKVNAELEKTANALIQNGIMDPQTAFDRAAEIVTSQFKTVNGVPIHFGNRAVPQTYETDSSFLAQRYFEKYGADEGLTSPDELVLVPANSSHSGFKLVNKNTLQEVERATEKGEDGLPLGYLSSTQLGRINGLREQKVKAEIAAKQAATATQAAAEAEVTAASGGTISEKLVKAGVVGGMESDAFIKVGKPDFTGANPLDIFKWTPSDQKVVDEVKAKFGDNSTVGEAARATALRITSNSARNTYLNTLDSTRLTALRDLLERDVAKRGDDGDSMYQSVDTILKSRGVK